ncbi:protein ZINC INDUCED FACILITATOR-LIKE 1-like isoform X1 [Silene latifolia]|uniref:protein ZINC INDUCED FACILITATOR-LIKE 1-like isoform X1 n=1 Tax=Silene latifolia TaxID=37657 RepID=UPI003D771A32
MIITALSTSSIFPFLYFMIRDFHIAKREEDISFYAGFIGCSLLVGRFLTSLLWGIVADRYGRKPVMIIGTMAVLIFNATFGLSKSYWMAITSRFLLGACNGVIGPMRAYVTEVCRREHQPLGVSLIMSAWGIGLVIGPAIGGFLAQPAEKFPNVFSQESIFGRFPYFLASLAISIYALFVFVICFWLPVCFLYCVPYRAVVECCLLLISKLLLQETLHSHSAEDKLGFNDVEKSQSTESKSSNSSLTLLRNWPLMSMIIVFSIFQMHDTAYSEVFSLWAVSPRSLGGLSFSTDNVGQALAAAGIGMLSCNLILYPALGISLGPLTVTRTGAVLSILLLTCLPFTTNLRGVTLTLVIDLASILQNMFSCIISIGLFLQQNRAVSQEQRGAANGIALSITSLCNAIGPAIAGTVLSWAQSRQNASFLPGSHMVFFVLNMVKFIGLLMTFKPFLVKPAQEFD